MSVKRTPRSRELGAVKNLRKVAGVQTAKPKLQHVAHGRSPLLLFLGGGGGAKPEGDYLDVQISRCWN